MSYWNPNLLRMALSSWYAGHGLPPTQKYCLYQTSHIKPGQQIHS